MKGLETGAERKTIIADLTHWFCAYRAAYNALAVTPQWGNAPLLDYYAVPATLIGAKTDRIILSPEALTGYGGVGADLENLTKNGFVGAEPASIDIRLLTPRSAIIEGRWSDRFVRGPSREQAAIYVVAKGACGWRIKTVIEQISTHAA